MSKIHIYKARAFMFLFDNIFLTHNTAEHGLNSCEYEARFVVYSALHTYINIPDTHSQTRTGRSWHMFGGAHRKINGPVVIKINRHWQSWLLLVKFQNLLTEWDV
jgi:hypothetical protein